MNVCLRRAAALVAAAVATAVVLAACGSSNPSSAASAPHGRAEASATSLVSQAKAALAVNYRGTDGPLPKSAPTPPKGKSVWIIACSLSAQGCADPAKAAAQAAQRLGWTTHVEDGQLNPATYNSLIREAVAAKANAIILVSVDCDTTKSSLQAAKSAGVKIVGVYALDCNATSKGGPALFSTQITYENGMTYGRWLEGPYAQSIADWTIAKTDGKANVIMVRENDVEAVKYINNGYQAAMKKCATCKLTTVSITGADLLNGQLQTKVATAINQNPAANVVMVPYDAAVTLGVSAAVEASGRKILLTGSEGLTPNIAMIKSGKGQDFAAGAPARWVGWAAIDELIRSFDHKPAVNEGIGLQSIDAQHNIPKETPFYDGNTINGMPKQNYEANFLRIWGLKG